MITAEKLIQYLPNNQGNLPAVIGGNTGSSSSDFTNERDIMYKILFDMRNDINDLKKLTLDILKNGSIDDLQEENHKLLEKIYKEQHSSTGNVEVVQIPKSTTKENDTNYDFIETIEEDESLSLQDKEVEMIKKSLEKNNNKRKLAAKELGISERTLYRKIKQYDL